MTLGKSIVGSVVAALLFTGCTATNRASKPFTEATASQPVRLTSSPAVASCKEGDVRITGTHSEGVTAGVLSFSVTLASKSVCSLASLPAISILDANDKLITAGASPVRRISPGGTTMSGDWQGVCTPAVLPLKVAVSWSQGVVRGPFPEGGLPICWGPDGAPGPRTGPAPSGYLGFSNHEG